MKFSILVQEGPSTLSRTIARFCKILLGHGHEINCLFFYGPGVLNLVEKSETLTDWLSLGVDLYACSVSSENLDITEPVKIAGLTTFFGLSLEADRTLRF